jgi:DNA processing protein
MTHAHRLCGLIGNVGILRGAFALVPVIAYSIGPSGLRSGRIVPDCGVARVRPMFKGPHMQSLDVSHESNRRKNGYRPPESVAVETLGAMLQGIRSIPAGQQRRFGFEEDGGSGMPIWYSGDVLLLKGQCVAIVGTRKVSTQGAARARRLARELVANGVVVVSGLAEGVDTEAHQAAIGAGGRTVAVIGTPIDRAFPAANARLQEQIYLEHLLLSQFSPGSPVFRGNFPARNKVMAAVSDATVVIEASDTSGTLHQVAECVRLQRPVFIAKSILDDTRLQWPQKFLGQPNVHILNDTKNVMTVLENGRA